MPLSYNAVVNGASFPEKLSGTEAGGASTWGFVFPARLQSLIRRSLHDISFSGS
jgi:hypothetical protein